jgi:hypothetical protein
MDFKQQRSFHEQISLVLDCESLYSSPSPGKDFALSIGETENPECFAISSAVADAPSLCLCVKGLIESGVPIRPGCISVDDPIKVGKVCQEPWIATRSIFPVPGAYLAASGYEQVSESDLPRTSRREDDV